MGSLLVSGGDAAELLKFAEAAFNEVPLFVKLLVKWLLLRSGRVVWDDCDRTGIRDSGAEVVGIIGGIGHDDVRSIGAEKGLGLRSVAAMSSSKNDPGGTAEPPHSDMDFGAQAAARAAKGLILTPFFAPAACW